MPKGKPKGGHKGRMKRYLTAEEIAEQEEKKKREQDWKKKKGIASNEGDEDESDMTTPKDDVAGATGGQGLEEEGEESESEESSDEEETVSKSKGIEHLIEIENPNRVQQKGKKVQNVDVNAKVELSRREREEIQKQRDSASYRKKHEAGRTEEAQRDLARLALIRQQREEAARKREAAAAAAAKKEGTKK